MKALSDEQGETLIELLITIVIMSIGVTAVAAAMFTVVVGSDVHRSMSQGEVVLRDFGEAIKTKAQTGAAYTACPTGTNLDPSDGTTYTAGAASGDPLKGPIDTVATSQAGTGWKAQITNVEYWTAPTNVAPSGTFADRTTCQTTFNACVPTVGAGLTAQCDPGLQRVTYRVFNSRTDVGQQEITARVLTRRNNAATP